MYIFGWIANVLVFIYKLPQMYILWKVKQTTGLSLYSLCIQVTSYVLYIIHGIFTEDTALSYGMIPALCQNIILILLYLYYQNINTLPVESNEGWYIGNYWYPSRRHCHTNDPIVHFVAIRVLFKYMLKTGYKYTRRDFKQCLK